MKNAAQFAARIYTARGETFMNKKENWLRLVKNNNPGWIGNPWEAFRGDTFGDIFIGDPIQAAANGTNKLGKLYMDGWGTQWIQQTGSPSATPYITDENKALKDIKNWRRAVTFPNLDGYDWSCAVAFNDSIDRGEHMTMSFVTGGLFERSHYLMGFEDALCNFMEEKEEMEALLGAIADWKIGQLERIFYYLRPDVIHFHDDWGSKANLFLPPHIWRMLRVAKYFPKDYTAQQIEDTILKLLEDWHRKRMRDKEQTR
jgi:hypothetical protein